MSRLALISRGQRTGSVISDAIELPPGERFITVRIPIDGWPRRQGQTTREREVIDVAVQWSEDGQEWSHFAGFSTGGFPEQPNRRGDVHPDAAIRPDFPLPAKAQFVRAVVDCHERLNLKLDIDTSATYEGGLV
jgi:hypothetical protein